MKRSGDDLTDEEQKGGEVEKNEISIHEVKVFLALKDAKWKTNKELSEETKIPNRTVTFKTKKFVDLGICDLAEVFPGHRYRLADKASKRNSSYMKRLEQAQQVFGL